MNQFKTVSAAAALLAVLASGAAQAQEVGDINPTKLTRLVFEKQTGHDKCVGQGHQNGNGGGGHDEGECDDESTPPSETPTGPVATTICSVDDDTVVESSWSRASCATVSYNENYLAAVVADNEDYPTTLIEYAQALDAEAVDAQISSLDERVVAGAGELQAGVAEALPLIGGPTPGPVVDEAAEAVTTYAMSYTAGIDERIVAGTGVLLAGVAEALPLIGGPTPGPVVDEILNYSLDAPTRISAGVTVLGDAATRALPLIGGPTPGPVVDELRELTTVYATEYVAGADERVISGAGLITGAVTRTLPLIGGPTPGPVVDEYRVGTVFGR